MQALTAQEIQMVRKRLGMSQAKFAATFRLNTATVQAWEQGRQSPSGAAMVLLWLLSQIPETILRVLNKPS